MRGPDFFSYGFSMIGFHFIAKIDRRPFPSIYDQFVVRGDLLRGYFVNFHETPQGRGARDTVAAARRRQNRKRR